MKLIKTIIHHGDLNDVKFIEKSLSAKFNISYGSKEDGTPDIQTLYFDSDGVLGNPIHVNVTIWSKEMQKKRDEIADISFESFSDKNFIADCLHLNTVEFFAFFGGNFVTVGPNGLLPIKGSYREQAYPGKDGTAIHLSISFGSKDNLVGGIESVQRK